MNNYSPTHLYHVLGPSLLKKEMCRELFRGILESNLTKKQLRLHDEISDKDVSRGAYKPTEKEIP